MIRHKHHPANKDVILYHPCLLARQMLARAYLGHDILPDWNKQKDWHREDAANNVPPGDSINGPHIHKLKSSESSYDPADTMYQL